jgi:hypothetical protein
MNVLVKKRESRKTTSQLHFLRRRRADGSLGSAERTSDGRRGGAGVPVGAGWGDVVASHIAAAEAQVRGAQRTGRGDDASEVASDAAVVANTAAGLAHQVVAERADRGVELLEDDGLCLDLADLLADDPVNTR